MQRIGKAGKQEREREKESRGEGDANGNGDGIDKQKGTTKLENCQLTLNYDVL